jgi:hypothetical protein
MKTKRQLANLDKRVAEISKRVPFAELKRKGYAEKVTMPDGSRVYPWMTAEGYPITETGRIVY